VTPDHTPATTGPERRLSSQEMARFRECVLPYLDAAHNLARYLLRDPHEAEEAVLCHQHSRKRSRSCPC
jgi:hypothetical protein